MAYIDREGERVILYWLTGVLAVASVLLVVLLVRKSQQLDELEKVRNEAVEQLANTVLAHQQCSTSYLDCKKKLDAVVLF